jgi:hypothetical protein
MSKSIVRTSFRIIGCSFLLAAFFNFVAATARADTPTFKAPEVNEYVKKQTALMDDYIAALKAGDDEKKEAANKAKTRATGWLRRSKPNPKNSFVGGTVSPSRLFVGRTSTRRGNLSAIEWRPNQASQTYFSGRHHG